MPSTYLLTWNPDRWAWTTLADDARRSSEGDVVKERWSSGNTKRIAPGDRLFLIRLGKEPKGIVAAGWAVHAPTRAAHWDAARASEGDEALYVDAEFERILDPAVDAPLPHAELRRTLGDFSWSPQASGIEIPGAIAEELEVLWARRLAEGVLQRAQDPEMAAFEGEVRSFVVRHRRREARLRQAKLAAALEEHGRLLCEVPGCGFDFEARYGDTGRGYAHVHHLLPLANREAPRLTRLDDLAVVCANCHAMIHIGGACRPLAGLIAS